MDLTNGYVSDRISTISCSSAISEKNKSASCITDLEWFSFERNSMVI